jgi:hypothetical protein
MTFDYPGYPLSFIQRQRCLDETAHQFSWIYKFFSLVTRYFYILRAEQHEGNVFAVKFYCKKDRRSEFKYSKIVNKGDLGNIVMSCATVIPLLLQQFPGASFAFAASRSVDTKNKLIESGDLTQRYLLYAYMIPAKFGTQTFEHIQYELISSYLLLNRNAPLPLTQIENMLKATYPNLRDLYL